MRIKYDRTCQRSIKVISSEKTFALPKSAQKNIFSWIFFFKESSWLALFNQLKIENFKKLWFFTLDDTLSPEKNIHYSDGKNPNRNWDAFHQFSCINTFVRANYDCAFLCVYLKLIVQRASKSLVKQILELTSSPIVFLKSQTRNSQGRPFSSRTNKYKNIPPGCEMKLAMWLSCDWQQSEVTQVISPHTSPIFNSQIIPDTFPDFHTFGVMKLKQTRHISRFPVLHTSRVIMGKDNEDTFLHISTLPVLTNKDSGGTFPHFHTTRVIR